jgi:DHA1 family tetracycline resistance protein-like MFS transporter
MVAILIDAIGLGIVMPVFPAPVMKLNHGTLSDATRIGGWLWQVYAAMQFLRGPLVGGLGALGFAIDYLVVGFAPSIRWLILAGIFGASYGPAMAALADITNTMDRAKSFGRIGGRSASASSSAPLGALRAIGHVPAVLPLVSAYFFWQFAVFVYPVTWAYFAIASFDWSSKMTGLSLGVSGLGMALVQMLLVGRVVKRIGERRAAMFGLAAAACAFAGYTLTRSTALAFCMLAISAFQAFVQPSLMAMMSKRVAPDQQGELQGLNASVAALGAILAPFVLAQPLALFTGPHTPFYFPGAAFAVSTVSALIAMAIIAVTPKAQVQPA